MEGKDGRIGVLYGRVGSMEGWKGCFGFPRHKLKPVLVFGGRKKTSWREIA